MKYSFWIIILCIPFLLFSVDRKKALIFGVTGQDGAYLSEFLLKKNYEVHGVKRRSSSHNTSRIDALYEDPHQLGRNFILHYGDITDMASVMAIVNQVKPDEIYNLAAQSHVKVSFELPVYTCEVDGLGTLHILEAIHALNLTNKTKFYQASTSELYGLVQEVPQNEKTPFYPRSPYGVAKLFSYWMVINYRESYNLFACNGILFNHESPIRGETFVTQKVVQAACQIKKGKQDCLYLGNLDAKRDWGYAKDYVEAMWLMLQKEKPDDYVVATGETHSVREFVEETFNLLGITLQWRGLGLDEEGFDSETNKVYVKIDSHYFRPSEVELLLGDSTKAKNLLNWQPHTHFKELVKIMVDAELKKGAGI